VRRTASDTGFTLLEVMIALGVLSIALVALLGLRNRDIQLTDYARNLTRATLLAQDRAFQAGRNPDLALGYLEGDFGTDYPGFRWRQDVATFMIERVREVRVVVLWGDDERVEVTRFVEAP